MQRAEQGEADGQSPNEELPVSETVAAAWKITFDSLKVCIKYPQLSETTLALLLQSLTNYTRDTVILFPDESLASSIEELKNGFHCYKDFLTSMSNIFVYLLTKDLGKGKSEHIWKLYNDLLKKLHYNNEALFLHLMEKFISCLETIVDTCVHTPMHYQPVLLRMFVVDSNKYMKPAFVPLEAFESVTLTRTDDAAELVAFLTKIVFTSIDLLRDTKLHNLALNALFKRFSAIDDFGAKEINELSMLENMDITSNPELIAILDGIMANILHKKGPGSRFEEWEAVEKQIVTLLLSSNFPTALLSNLQMVKHLKDAVLPGPFHDEAQEMRLARRRTAFTHIMRSCPGLVVLSEREIKWLAQHVCRYSARTPLALLMAYMESELQSALPLLVAQSDPMLMTQLELSADAAVLTKRTHPRIVKWHNAEDHSMVWPILKDLWLHILHRLSFGKRGAAAAGENRNEDESTKTAELQSADPLSDINKLHGILQEVAVVCCKLEQVQRDNPDQAVNVYFHFFQNQLEEVLQNITTLPSYFLPTEDNPSMLIPDEANQWKQFLELLNCLRQLPEAWQLGQRELSLLEALSGLLWFKIQDDKKPPLQGENLQWLLQLSNRLVLRIGNWEDKPLDFYNCDNLDPIGLIVKSFFMEFHQIKGRVTSWRAHVLEQCLMNQSNTLKAIAIQSVPLVITSCHRDDVPKLLKCLENLKEIEDKNIALTLAQTVPLVVCALSGRCDLIKEVDECSNVNVKTSVQFRAICHECDPKGKHLTPRGWNLLSTWDDFTSIWIHLLQHSDYEVRKAMADGFQRICKHLGDNLKPCDVSCWMKLLKDDEWTVGAKIAPYVPLLFTSHRRGEKSTAELFEVVYLELKDTVFKCIWRRSSEHWKIVLQAILVTSNETFSFICLPMTKILTLIIAFGNPKCYDITQTMISKFASTHNVNPKTLFWQSSVDLWKIIVSVLQTIPAEERNIIATLNKLINIFSMDEISLKKQLYRFLQELIPKCVTDPSLVSVIEEVASYVKASQQTMIRKWYPILYPLIRLEQSSSVALASIELMGKLMNGNDNDIIKQYQTLIIGKLMFDFDSQPKKVLKIVTDIFQIVDSKIKPPLTNGNIRNLLQPHLLGILVNIQDNVLQKYVGDDVRLKAIRSLTKLCTYMGTKFISPYHNKILNIICTFTHLKNPHLNEAFCLLVFAFVKCIEPKHLGPIVLIIVTNLMHLDWNMFYDHLKPTMDYLLVEMRQVTEAYLPELVNATEFMKHFGFTRVVLKSKANLNKLSTEEVLSIKLKSISCRHEKSQILGLLDLKQYIVLEQEKLQKILFGYDNHNPTLRQIIGRLLEGSASANSEIRRVSIECLGNLGAMDPNHWIVAYGFRQKSIFYIDAMCPTFVANSFELLVEEFHATSNNSEIDIIALVCQDLMRAHDFQDEPQKAPVEIWTKLSEQTQLMLTPFFKSSYASSVDIDEKQLPHPIFGSNVGRTFQSWLFNWACRLIGMVKNPKAKRAFTAMKWLFNMNLKCTLFFLPHIFMYAVWSASGRESTKIIDEMMVAGRLANHAVHSDNLDSEDIIFNSLNLSCSIQSFSSMESSPSDLNLLVQKTSQVIFFLMDYTLHWKLEFERFQQAAKHQQEGSRVIDLTSGSGSSSGSKFKPSQFCAQEARHQAVKDLLAELSLVAAAESSHMCNENFRALRYLEMHVVRNRSTLQNCLELFLRIYVQLQEEDGVSGVVACITGDTSQAEQLLVYEMNGQLQEAITSYEGLIGDSEPRPQVIRNMAKAYLCLGEYHSALALTDKHNTYANCGDNDFLLAVKLEVLWRLGRWEPLQQLLQEYQATTRSTWALHFAHILLALQAGNLPVARQAIASIQNELGEWLFKSSFKSGVYAHNYSAFLFMHIAVDIEAVVSLMELHASCVSASGQNEEVWLQRVRQALNLMVMRQRRVSSSWRSLEQLLSLQRTLLELLQQALAPSQPASAACIQEHIGMLWLQSAKLALSRRQFPQVLHYTLNADKSNMKEAFVVRSQLEWETGKRERALLYLKRGVRTHFPNESAFREMPRDELREERLICAKAKLLIADYSNEMKIVCPVNSVRLYKEALSVFQYCEESWVKLSRAWQTLKKDKNENSDEKNLGMLLEEVKGYCRALCFGIKHLYESLPRIISVWANTGLTLFKSGRKSTSVSSDNKPMLTNYFKQFNDVINTLKSQIPMYAFYACFTHLSSRLCHPYKLVYTNIQSIFLMLLEAFPHQMLWKLVPMLKVSHAVRVNRVQEVLIQYRRKNPNMSKLVEDYLTLVDSLFNLGHAVPKTSKSWTTMKLLAPYLPKLYDENSKFSKILMPSQDLIGVLLPSEDVEDYKTHDAFPRPAVYITGVNQPVQIISSLQKPKKFLLVGSDGNEYPWLVKIKDDLRIDGLVMEFMQVLNTLLQHEPECKERSLHCQTYTVVPLGEDCGLIEWVPNLVPLRETIYNVYKGMGQKLNVKNEIKKCENPVVMRRIFEKYWLPSHPPVLGSWFVQQFPEDSAWHASRKRFVYSTAVMSMVGYILGLGDRHGGNIMLNVVTGQSVHVDFNCLFNKGETLPWPERVPFRLTHNLVLAMGGTGTEGAYQHTCELILRLIRQNLETLLAVVRPILYDASRKDRLDQTSEPTDEFFNFQLVSSINRIKLRMSGFVNDKEREKGSAESILSPEGHAQAIIKQAMDIKNLCQMYPGWGAFL